MSRNPERDDEVTSILWVVKNQVNINHDLKLYLSYVTIIE